MDLDFVDDDIGNHAPLDDKVYAQFESDRNQAPPILGMVLCAVADSAPDKMDVKFQIFGHAMATVKLYSELSELLCWCWKHGSFEKIRRLKILRPTAGQDLWKQSNWYDILANPLHIYSLSGKELNKAYTTPFLGTTATEFVTSLVKTDEEILGGRLPTYARAISILQSSGTGKSRLLTEVGNQIFTLPICLRNPNDPGYPPSDRAVHHYFAQLRSENDLSYTAHSAIASFLAAAHQTMLKWLEDQQEKEGFVGRQLHMWWYNLMERGVPPKRREEFFSEVLDKANTMKSPAGSLGESPKSSKEKGDPVADDIVDASRSFYEEARVAVKALMSFLADLHVGPSPICVTYFDEAHELGTKFWILMRLLSHQPLATKMWYVFMGTKSTVSYYSPSPRDLSSLRLGSEIRTLLPPYIALDFDQNVRNDGEEVTTTIGELQSLEHLATYGRPLWKAHLPENIDEMVQLASWKLINGSQFHVQDKNQVFAVLSQRLCLEPVLVSSEAIALADQSVAHHMRLITGISADRRTFHTCSPSEPILVLGAANILYNTKEVNPWGRVLDTFSKKLCSSGLVEKGLIGELGARLLLLLARDFATPKQGGRVDLLQPVRLLDMLDTLFGNTTWTGSDLHQEAYNNAFGTAYVNFTHWIVTKDPLPEIPDQLLLANLWARGAILQCCFNQEAVDFMIVIYHGSIAPNAVFDPAKLSAVFGQVKNRNKADTKAERAIRPIGLSRDLTEPLPYLALLLELGSNSNHGATNSKIKVTIPEPAEKDRFQKLKASLEAAEVRRDQQFGKKRAPLLAKMQNKVKEARVTMDSYNRYTIAVRGARSDVYGILTEPNANLEAEFATLFSTTMPSPTLQDDTIQHMRPLERLGGRSGHNAWMSNYVAEKSEEHPMEVDS